MGPVHSLCCAAIASRTQASHCLIRYDVSPIDESCDAIPASAQVPLKPIHQITGNHGESGE